MTVSNLESSQAVKSAIVIIFSKLTTKDLARVVRVAQSRFPERFIEEEGETMLYKNVLDKAVERIKGYCLKLVGCEGCRFETENGCMFKQSIPADWELSDKKKEK